MDEQLELWEKVPTYLWRSAMTLPRDLRIEKVNGKYLLASLPSPELKTIAKNRKLLLKNIRSGLTGLL